MATATGAGVFLAFFVAVPILVSVVLDRVVDFDAAELPVDYSLDVAAVERHHGRILSAVEELGEGLLLGPEDLAYDEAGRAVYTGCSDGWIRRVGVGEDDPTVEKWAFVGGRPLGVALVHGTGALVVANADKGLMIVEKNRSVKILTEEAEGQRFGLTDGVDIDDDGTIYFTDASYKYGMGDYNTDFLEGRPHGRLLSFNPSTNQTLVLLRDLYFANGVSLSPDRNFLIYCETFMRRCRKYHIHGDQTGTVENFVENIPGFPDNIHYDGRGHYWIGLPSGKSKALDIIMRYKFLRKVMYMVGKSIEMSSTMRDGGVLKVDLEGKLISLYTDPKLSTISAGLRIGNYIYLGSLMKPHLGRVHLNLTDM